MSALFNFAKNVRNVDIYFIMHSKNFNIVNTKKISFSYSKPLRFFCFLLLGHSVFIGLPSSHSHAHLPNDIINHLSCFSLLCAALRACSVTTALN